MKALGHGIVELLGLLIIGSGIAFTMNGLRSDPIKPTKNYFDMKLKTPVAGKPHSSEGAKPVGDGEKKGAEVSTPTVAKNPGSEPTKHPKHDFQEVTTEEAFKLFNDSEYESGLYVFVDARNDERFAEGRIPGAIQCDHYKLEDYIDAVLEAVKGAGRVVVYCNGGECEDSIFVCKELVDSGVPYDAVYLYAGGWKEWTQRGFPVETGEPQS